MIRIATRGSPLALWQANHVRERLIANDKGLRVDLVILKTRGDKIIDRPLAQVGGKGLFVKEIEDALLDGRAEVAVHSMKDLPAEIPDGLTLGAVPTREDARDALVVRRGVKAGSIAELPEGARVGTSSLRRSCQLRARRPDLVVMPLRGNVDTRLRKLDDGDYDAVVLACAGLIRLGHSSRITGALSTMESLPAIGQGALALECRGDDEETLRKLERLDHLETRRAVAAERTFLQRLQGGCQTPLAAHAQVVGVALMLDGMVGTPDGSEVLRDTIGGRMGDAEAMGLELAERLLKRGADRILAACKSNEPVGGP